MLPGLLLRSLIPVGYMPMFGPGLSIGLMLCPAYAPVPVPAQHAATDTSMDMPGMDMPGMDARALTAANNSSPPQRGSPEHQDHTLCPYAASATLAAPPACLMTAACGARAAVFTQFSPQIAYFQRAPRAQSARGPPTLS